MYMYNAAAEENVNERAIDLLCFSHLRWDFVYQRPQHLMSRFAQDLRVFFIEDPIFEGTEPALRVRTCPLSRVNVVVPVLPAGTENPEGHLEILLRKLIASQNIRDYVAWYYTPAALAFTTWLRPSTIVYDCMDELSLFRGASPLLVEHEKALLSRADLVFTGGRSLFEAKCTLHEHVHVFPSSVDVPHFAQARRMAQTAADQETIPAPRIGYAGVIDERIDLDLIRDAAARRPEWQFVMIGPVVKIDPATLPQGPNIHYLGMKPYADLPTYFAGWDVAMMPFARNEATRFISPTKTPEYLAAGLPVVSTSIKDVIRPYGELGLASIADSPEDFCDAIARMLTHGMSLKWRQRADHFLSSLSWDDTWRSMNRLMTSARERRLAKVRKAVPSMAPRLERAFNV